MSLTNYLSLFSLLVIFFYVFRLIFGGLAIIKKAIEGSESEH